MLSGAAGGPARGSDVARVLVVEDEVPVLTALARGLRGLGHEVVVARTSADGLAAAALAEPEAVLLDLYLPDLDGIEVLRRLRSFTDVPVLMLSGAATDRARIRGLDAGADDFVDKPFSLAELQARLGAALRRCAGQAGGPVPAGSGAVADVAGLRIDVGRRWLEVDGEPRHLTPTEWRLLEVLLEKPGRLLTYGRLAEMLWGRQRSGGWRGALRVHVRSLRAKLGDAAAAPRFIATEPGVGYTWIADADASARV